MSAAEVRATTTYANGWTTVTVWQAGRAVAEIDCKGRLSREQAEAQAQAWARQREREVAHV